MRRAQAQRYARARADDMATVMTVSPNMATTTTVPVLPRFVRSVRAFQVHGFATQGSWTPTDALRNLAACAG